MVLFKNNKQELISLLVGICIFSFCASIIQSSFGSVDIKGVQFPTQNGQWVSADLFKPKSATKDNPAPLVIVIPGFQRTKETLSNISLELSRRGIVVISIDPYAQGSSSSSMSRLSATEEGYGMFAIVDYIYNTSNLNYIDKNMIAATGHSAGGNAALKGASYFGKQAKNINKESKLHSIFVSGYVLTMKNKILKYIDSNIGASYAFYDEGSFRNELKTGDMRYAKESLRLINSSIENQQKPIDLVSIGKYYGKVSNRSLRVMFNEKLLHPFQPYSREATKNQIDYFSKVFNLKNTINSSNQIWFYKDIFTLFSLVFAMLSILPFVALIIKLKVFKVLVKALPEKHPALNRKGKIVFWALFIISASIACISFIPLSELSKQVFIDASNRMQTWFFPQRMNNAIMLWALFNGIVGFSLFFLSYVYLGKSNGVQLSRLGLNIPILELIKTISLAIVIFLFFYLTLFFMYYLFHVDYRFLFFGIRTFQPNIIPIFLMYVPFFLVFFISNSLRVNSSFRIQGLTESKSLVLAGLANIFGLFLIIIIQYTFFALTGTIFWNEGNSWLYINLLFSIIPIMFILPYYNRYFFNITGNIYLGPITMTLIFIMILTSNTVIYIPLK